MNNDLKKRDVAGTVHLTANYDFHLNNFLIKKNNFTTKRE